MFQAIKSKIGVGIVVAGFLLLSLTTTGVAASKLWQAYQTKSPEMESLEIQTPEDLIEDEEEAATPSSSPTPSPTSSPISSPTPSPRSIVSLVAKPTSIQVNPNACVVTISGKQYDITPLRSTHSGGDIFVCGTDMTQTYQNQHGMDVSRIAKYSLGGAQQATQSGQAYSDDDDHDEDESEEEQERYVEEKEVHKEDD